MNNEEANRVIAEYMGAVFYDTHDPSPILILDGFTVFSSDSFLSTSR